jgi:hypothetical protein
MAPSLLVIDTQSLLDWLVFGNPGCAGWPGLLSNGTWKWIYTPAMRAEFDFVAAKGFGARWPVVPEELERAWSSFAHSVDPPAPLGAGARLHCTDPDDQKFIDLAIAVSAHTLVTRDKALLKLARKARERHGLRICAPLDWLQPA